MAKRYACYDGEMVEAPGSSYNGRLKYVLENDYAALESANAKLQADNIRLTLRVENLCRKAGIKHEAE